MIELLEVRIAPAVLLTHAGQLINDPDAANVVTTDSDGNIIVVGGFRDVMNANLGAGVANVSTSDGVFGDLFIAKYDADFRLLWVKSWGGAGQELPSDIAVDFAGDIYVTGSFLGSNAGFGGFGPINAATAYQAFVLKLDGASGAAESEFDGDGQLTFGNGSTTSNGYALAIDNSGAVLVGGDFSGGGAGINGSGFFNVSNPSGFVLRLNSSGQLDSSFANEQGGITLFAPGEGGFRSVFRIEVGQTGDLYLGRQTLDGSDFTSDVIRYDANGSSFVETYGANGVVRLASEFGPVDFTLDNGDQLTGAFVDSEGAVHGFRYFSNNGNLDPTYGLNAGAGEIVLPLGARSVSIAIDQLNRAYLTGETDGQNYLVRLQNSGAPDTLFAPGGKLFYGQSNTSSNSQVGLVIDSEGYLILRGGYEGKPDLDPGKDVKKLPARFTFSDNSQSMEDGFLLRVDPAGVKAGQPFIDSVGFPETGGPEMLIITTMTGPGRGHVYESNSFGTGSIDAIELFNTTLASNLKVVAQNSFTTRTVGAIYTHGSLQHVGSITVSSNLAFGFGFSDLFDFGLGRRIDDSGIFVTGKLNSLTLGEVRNGTYISLGRGLPYNEPDATTPDTYNNRPNITLGEVGEDVTIDVTGDGFTPQGVGGGGLGKVVVGSWENYGVIRTTQSIGSFTVLRGDFYGILEVDKFGVGEGTTANVGEMTVQDGAWGSSGTEIEGNVGEFNAEAFLQGASIEAGSISKINVDGVFAGTVELTEGNANSFGTFNVTTDFTGKINSLSSLKKINIKGDFKGSLSAPSIASITAFSFLGTTTEDGEGDPTMLNITTTGGFLGKITAKSGVIKDYEFNSPVAFGGIKVSLKNLIGPAVGIENVRINATSIGPIEVNLAGKANTAGVSLTGIANSSFTTDGPMGKVTVKIKGGSGESVGLSSVNFAADTIGKVLINVAKGKNEGAQAQAINVASFSALRTISAISIGGDATAAQVNELQVHAGGTIAGFAVASKTAAFGTLSKSNVLAGQNTDLAAIESATVLKRRVAAGALGAVKISGSMESTMLAAGGNLVSVTVGGDVKESFILGGALLGEDRVIGGDNDRFHRGAQVGAITIKGDFSRTTVSNGVDPVNGRIGDADDVAAGGFEGFEVIAAIKSISIGSGLTVSENPPDDTPAFALQAGAIGKLTIGKEKFTDFSVPLLLLAGGEGKELDDVVVRLI